MMQKYFLWLFGSLILLCYTLIDRAAPITSNSTRQVTLVEYYDYECPHCRRMEAVIDQLQMQYHHLQVTHRVVPLLTPTSYLIARFALGAKLQGQWEIVHHALMQSPTAPNKQTIKRLTAALSLKGQSLLSQQQQTMIARQIHRNIQLAQSVAMRGRIILPTLVFTAAHSKQAAITLYGEQPTALLAAVVQQLSGSYDVAMVQQTKKTKTANGTFDSSSHTDADRPNTAINRRHSR